MKHQKYSKSIHRDILYELENLRKEQKKLIESNKLIAKALVLIAGIHQKNLVITDNYKEELKSNLRALLS